MLRYAFDVMGRDKVISLIHPENVNSIRVAEKLGAVPGDMTEILNIPVRIFATYRA